MDLSQIAPHNLLGKLLRLPLRAVPKSAVVPILSGYLRGTKWIVGAGTHGCWLGTYEQDKQAEFRKEVGGGQVVFDIGANSGIYTLLASRLVGPNGRVIAFEPLPANLAYLRQHVALNGIENVSVVDAAVSDRDGVAWFEVANSSYMGRIATQGDLKVKTVALDSYCEQESLPLPDVLKIDIEGAEFSALQGARNLLMKARPTIYLATHGADVHKACCDFLTDLGYQCKPLDSANLADAREIVAC